ncbi:hypothetical protein [Spirosoma pollinicola]|uniref:RHS repeat protein n=1 Tax=Spirosoma pollinicola TaxID=2057025 RepID=A0A2K8YUL3_9BACT|nr:hypothetical protein [Spirosoma pollinicola]AUD01316.1 hypothetical protein CWM47_05530 [Spirosoma pollinicola]
MPGTDSLTKDNKSDRTTYAYDSEGKLLNWEFNLTNGDHTLKNTYTYDQSGYLTALTLVRTDRWYVKMGQPAHEVSCPDFIRRLS